MEFLFQHSAISGYQSVLQGLSNRLGNTRFSLVSDGNQSLCLCDETLMLSVDDWELNLFVEHWKAHFNCTYG